MPETKPDELYCFLNQGRQCLPECMAYEPAPPEGPDFKGKPWARCVLLTSVHRTSKAVGAVATGANAITTYIADLGRTRQTPPRGP